MVWWELVVSTLILWVGNVCISYIGTGTPYDSLWSHHPSLPGRGGTEEAG